MAPIHLCMHAWITDEMLNIIFLFCIIVGYYSKWNVGEEETENENVYSFMIHNHSLSGIILESRGNKKKRKK